MYAIREHNTLRFYYGVDQKWYPPKVKVSKRSHLMQFFNTLDEANHTLARIRQLTGREDFEVIEWHFHRIEK